MAWSDGYRYHCLSGIVHLAATGLHSWAHPDKALLHSKYHPSYRLHTMIHFYTELTNSLIQHLSQNFIQSITRSLISNSSRATVHFYNIWLGAHKIYSPWNFLLWILLTSHNTQSIIISTGQTEFMIRQSWAPILKKNSAHITELYTVHLQSVVYSPYHQHLSSSFFFFFFLL